jgi:hypothetical protein
MSGGSVPYHLRQNKAVERGVFVDVLVRAGRATPKPIQQYKYIGMAGAFSEDFKLMHAQIGVKKFLSIENDRSVLDRQRWNQPLRGIDYREGTTGVLIDEYAPSGSVIVWLDYASPRQLALQLAEVQQLVAKLLDYDILKVTLCASDQALEGGPGADTIAHKVNRARQRLGDYLHPGDALGEEQLDRSGYPRLLLKCAERAVKRGMEGSGRSRFQLLTAFVYQDSEHRMLTFTGIVLPKGKATAFLRDSGIGTWDLATTRWGDDGTDPIPIQIPELSLRERLFVDQQLPKRGTPRTIMRKLGFRIASGSDEKTLAALGSYRQFYRYFPYFSKMVV